MVLRTAFTLEPGYTLRIAANQTLRRVFEKPTLVFVTCVVETPSGLKVRRGRIDTPTDDEEAGLMPELWTYLKAVLSHWWTAMSCAVLTFLSVYATLAGKGGMWVVWTTAGLAVCFLFSGTFFAWRKEYLANVAYAAAFTR